MGVLVEEHNGLGIFLTGSQEFAVLLQFSNRIGVHVIDAATPADGEETAVLV